MDIELWKKKKKELHLTLNDIADITDISISTLKDIFRGKTYSPRIDTVQAIEKALGINDTTYTEEDFANGVFLQKKVMLTADEEAIVLKFRELKAKLGNKAFDVAVDLLDVLLKN